MDYYKEYSDLEIHNMGPLIRNILKICRPWDKRTQTLRKCLSPTTHHLYKTVGVNVCLI